MIAVVHMVIDIFFLLFCIKFCFLRNIATLRQTFGYVYTENLRISRMWQKVSFKGGLTDLNVEFSVSSAGCITKVNETSLFSHS